MDYSLTEEIANNRGPTLQKRISFEIKEQMVALAGACFWYWNSFYSFLDSSGVAKSLQKRYPQSAFNKYQVMRNILGDLENDGQTETISALISNFYRLTGIVDKDKLDADKAKVLLQNFRDSVGTDPIDAAIRKKELEKSRENYQTSIEGALSYKCKLSRLNERFMALSSAVSVTPQQRGFELETLSFDILHFAEIEHTKPYRTSDGEQIDGHFKYEKFDYLVEAKWIAGLTKQKDLSIFDGKIRGKAQSTRGLFLAAEGFDGNAVQKFSGDAPRIVLMTGEDIAIILGGQVSMFDALKAKIDAIVRHGNIHFPVRDI
jgi:hypothetical protein